MDSMSYGDQEAKTSLLSGSHSRNDSSTRLVSTKAMLDALEAEHEDEDDDDDESTSPKSPTKMLMRDDEDDEDRGTEKHTERIMVDSLSFDYSMSGSDRRGEYDMLPRTKGTKSSLSSTRHLWNLSSWLTRSNKDNSSSHDEKPEDMELGLMNKATSGMKAVGPYIRTKITHARHGSDGSNPERTTKTRSSVSLESILQGKHMTPISLQDFRTFLKNDARCIQDLDFLQALIE